MVDLSPPDALAAPVANLVRPMPYPELYRLTEGGPAPAQKAARSLFVDAVDLSSAQAIVDHLQTSTAPLAMAQLRVLGAAMARVPAEETAYAHRQQRLMVALGAVYERAAETPRPEAWVSDFAAALRQGDARVYVNFLGDEGEARVRDAYPGSTWDRLAAIKARYDPTNLFRGNHNIPPAVERRELAEQREP
jgi:hypothetical protein